MRQAVKSCSADVVEIYARRREKSHDALTDYVFSPQDEALQKQRLNILLCNLEPDELERLIKDLPPG